MLQFNFILLLVYILIPVLSQNNSTDTNINNESLKFFNLFLSNPYKTNISTPKDAYNLNDNALNEISSLCPKNGFFASFNPNHSQAVSLLAQMFQDMKQSVSTDLTEAAEFILADPNIHPKVWYSAFLQDLLQDLPNRTKSNMPSPFHLFPTNFFPERIIQHNSMEPIRLNETFGQDNGPENALWYFREDIQLNAHHWFWHLIYPSNRSIAANRRRGELFSFFHHELLARYATERMANGLEPHTPLDLQLNSVVEEGYIPHLMDGISTRRWLARRPHQELIKESMLTELVNFTSNKFRVVEAVGGGQFTYSNQSNWFPINTADHINSLAELSEGTANTINPEVYGSVGYHNLGHDILSMINANFTVPEEERTIGVMGDNSVALRDPIFYRWHQFVDDVFTSYKATHLPPYRLKAGNHFLIVPEIITSSVKIIPQSEEHDARDINLLYTYWNTTRVHLENGLDFRNPMADPPPPPRNITVDAKHLDHEEFYYEINIENQRRVSMLGAVRIFMAPRYKTANGQQRYTMSEQRNLFFAMDSFTVDLHPGVNILHRNSEDSTLTVGWPRSIKEIGDELMRNNGTRDGKCGCGFPHHLLLPKGTEDGMLFDIFVIVTEEFLNEEWYGTQPSDSNQCTPSHIQCGAQGRGYPDAKPMGYPFDRLPYEIPRYTPNNYDNTVKIEQLPVATLEEYVAHIPNSCATQIVITHHDVQY